MADELLITQRRSINGLFLDATVNEGHIARVTLTQNPVEFGAMINDHRIRQPKKYNLTGRVSDIPLNDDPSDPWKNGNEETRSKSAWAIFNEMLYNGEPFIIETGLQRYDDMLIEVLTATQSAINAKVLDVVANCTQVIIVNTEEITVNFPEAGATEEQTLGPVDRGDVQTETPEESVETSWLLKLIETFNLDN